MKHLISRISSLVVIAVMALTGTTAFTFMGSFGPVNKITEIASTVPANGDVNPYGVAVIQQTTGALVRGDVLVSNFNNSANQQGTGTTIVEVSRSGKVKVFATIDAASLPGACPGGVGLTTALAVLNGGWVIVGSLPTSDGTAATAQAGCLIVLNNKGVPVETISGPMINGPWDMTAVQFGPFAALFVANVLDGTVAASPNVVTNGNVTRIFVLSSPSVAPQVLSSTVIASGFKQRTDPDALVIGPTGVGLARDGTLYVADSLDNRIAGIPDALFRQNSAGTGTTVSQGGAINTPLGLAIARNGDIVTVNGGDGNLVETTPAGKQVLVKMVDVTNTGAGTLFGLAFAPGGSGLYFVNDGNNKLYLLH